ncbi:hypothetical protein [Lacticaseibacillus mingshuiensis]|uniref:Uncharacterized protein n=1 Tax=Lacticaseibacillus mingshuiensis TaxID=2799574 RepID=A0ABW4CLA9_9LACO|nr:hypothetical protein [Lacticaseibacillus mingshuiensis]
MHEIPETMAAVANLVDKARARGEQTSEDDVIGAGLRNWMQELLDEAIEGGYLTAAWTPTGFQVTDINGTVIYAGAELVASAQIASFKTDAHRTLMHVQTTMRQLIDTGKIPL